MSEAMAPEAVPGASEPVLLLTTDEAALRLRIGKSTLYDLIRSGRLRTVKIGARRLVPVEALQAVIQVLMEETET